MHLRICGPRTKWISRMCMHMCIHMSLASCTDALKASFTDAFKDMRRKGKVNFWIRMRMCIHTWYASCADPLKDMRPKDKVNFLDPLGLNKVWIIKSLLATGWRRPRWCLIFIGHFPRTRPIILALLRKEFVALLRKEFVALLRKETRLSRHPMALRHPAFNVLT